MERNWKTKLCEIDIISKKNSVVYFVEVKYRGSDFQGDGFEYITEKKQHKMNFAAEIWKQTFGWTGDCRLMAASVSGSGYEDIALIELG